MHSWIYIARNNLVDLLQKTRDDERMQTVSLCVCVCACVCVCVHLPMVEIEDTHANYSM